jgi:hypothetical protein
VCSHALTEEARNDKKAMPLGGDVAVVWVTSPRAFFIFSASFSTQFLIAGDEPAGVAVGPNAGPKRPDTGPNRPSRRETPSVESADEMGLSGTRPN